MGVSATIRQRSDTKHAFVGLCFRAPRSSCSVFLTKCAPEELIEAYVLRESRRCMCSAPCAPWEAPPCAVSVCSRRA